jgi:ABC-type multidrug transport system fused ATPase/permease subunit
VDGRDLSRFRLRDYRSQLGVVMQDNFLFDGTIRDNIAFSRPDATDEQIRAAAHVANADEFIDRFEDGYDTIVGERGVKLSGGQRQRRGDCPRDHGRPAHPDPGRGDVEPGQRERGADPRRPAHLRQGRTTFVIAHRLSTIRSADQILVLDDGRIVERGTHAELLAAMACTARCTSGSRAWSRTSS